MASVSSNKDANKSIIPKKSLVLNQYLTQVDSNNLKIFSNDQNSQREKKPFYWEL